MRVLVTGGAGFIGSHVTRVLLGAGNAVTFLDNLSSGRRDLVPPEAAFIRGDLKDERRLPHWLAGHDAFNAVRSMRRRFYVAVPGHARETS